MLRCEKDIELKAKEIKKRGYERKIGDNAYNLSDPDSRKNEIIEELKNLEYNES